MLHQASSPQEEPFLCTCTHFSLKGSIPTRAYATAVILLIVVIIINAISGLIARKVAKK